MWVMVMFDLPTSTKEDRKNYTRFRKKLIESGFMQLQFSVYARPCFSDDTAQSFRVRIEKWVPQFGQVRIMLFTDKQWGRTEVFFGKRRAPTEEAPQQLTIF